MAKFKNFSTPHCHIASLDSASTPEAFAQRELELGTGTITITDHGTMGTCREVYNIAKKNGLTPILGLEGYHRDDDCEILTKAGIAKAAIPEYYKYGHLTIGYMDQQAYETGCRLLSDADDRAERHGSERKPLFTWRQLEELGAQNVTFTSSCLVGVVQRHLMADRPDIARSYYEKIRSLVKPGNFFVEVFPHRCDKNWVAGVFLTLEGEDKKLKFWTGKKLRVEIDGTLQESTAADLAAKFRRNAPGKVVLVAQKDGHAWVERAPTVLLNIEAIEDFIQNECRPWCPDGDVQKGGNRFMMELAQQYGDPIIISDDSHYVHPDEKAVQDIRLMSGGNTWRFYGHYHRFTSQEAWDYFKDFGVDQKVFEGWIDNSVGWAEKFKGFAFQDRKSLPTSFYPKDTFAHTYKLIQKHGRMNWHDPVMTERLKSEFRLLHKNGTIDLLPYFFTIEEACSLYQDHGLLTGPGRGSAAGLLLSYLLGITHVNPLKYDLSRDRFLTIDRIQSGKLPDVDEDLPSRDLLVGWEESGYEMELEDGSNRQVRLDAEVRTCEGIVTVKEAFTRQLDILEWL